MRAGGVDALTAPVSQCVDPAAADQFGEPAREIAGHQVAGGGGAIQRAISTSGATDWALRAAAPRAASS